MCLAEAQQRLSLLGLRQGSDQTNSVTILRSRQLQRQVGYLRRFFESVRKPNFLNSLSMAVFSGNTSATSSLITRQNGSAPAARTLDLY